MATPTIATVFPINPLHNDVHLAFQLYFKTLNCNPPRICQSRTSWVYKHMPDADAQYFSAANKLEWRCKYCSKRYLLNEGTRLIKVYLQVNHNIGELSLHQEWARKRQMSIEGSLLLQLLTFKNAVVFERVLKVILGAVLVVMTTPSNQMSTPTSWRSWLLLLIRNVIFHYV
jgi:hypothetical protein